MQKIVISLFFYWLNTLMCQFYFFNQIVDITYLYIEYTKNCQGKLAGNYLKNS